MGLRRAVIRRPAIMSAGIAFLLLPVLGCQPTQSVSVRRLIEHQALIDFSGLKPSQTIENLKVAASIPQKWDALPLQRKPLYMHQQWRSPSRSTGVGVAYIRMPIGVSAKTIVWFAKLQYAKQSTKDGKPEGQLIGEWTDSIGREWFEAENAKYHVKGYAVTSGFDAWIVYSGYRVKDPINPAELAMASRSMDTILPTPLAAPKPENGATAEAK
jgi:hypothetical protein